ncbi:unnamed protein product [Owenia fusiformis]|uniref:Fibrinogen C-terminal domain-containing protein n=1 Tax=Owenia fusiformis TaxID=6347 RepID=A0A8S4PXV6_OWEFU|nr:unnamed protein product [Owenia fusiformis]
MHLLTLVFGVILHVSISQAGHECGVCYMSDCCNDRSITGRKNIKTNGGKIFSAFCDQGWTYIMRRFNGHENFYRTWREYQNGFGKRDGEHFIGLDNLASFVKGRTCKVRFDLEAWPPVSPANRFAEYSVFSIADWSDKYRLTIGGYSGTAGNAFGGANGAMFSTYDQDNDSWGGNCALNYKGAMWHKACHAANPFGLYTYRRNCPSRAQCLTWVHWPGIIASPDNWYNTFKSFSMKINCCHNSC